MTSSAPDSIRGRRAAETRGKVLSAAIRLFSERGFSGVDMRSIAGAAGMSTGAVFAHFTGKDELFAACFPEDHKRRRVAEAVCLAVGGTWEPDHPSVNIWMLAAARALVGVPDSRKAAA